MSDGHVTPVGPSGSDRGNNLFDAGYPPRAEELTRRGDADCAAPVSSDPDTHPAMTPSSPAPSGTAPEHLRFAIENSHYSFALIPWARRPCPRCN